MFKLDFDIPPVSPLINIKDKIILVGSCFSENIGYKLSDYKFNTLINPFGTIYNPYSILNLLEHSVTDNQEVSTIKNGEVYYDWDSHSMISELDENELVSKALEARRAMKEWIAISKWLIVSPGTSRVYEYESTGQIVANCHKVPQKEFTKRLLDTREIVEQFEFVYAKVKKLNPGLNWIFTVSPVRHFRDGLVENNHSKSILIQSIHEIIQKHDNCHYFPSYEIVIDELRDYRFYEQDWVHPNELAIDYVWDRFKKATMDNETQVFISKWKKMKSALGHKPFKASSKSHQKFIKETISRLEEFSQLVDVSPEIFYLRNQIE